MRFVGLTPQADAFGEARTLSRSSAGVDEVDGAFKLMRSAACAGLGGGAAAGAALLLFSWHDITTTHGSRDEVLFGQSQNV